MNRILTIAALLAFSTAAVAGRAADGNFDRTLSVSAQPDLYVSTGDGAYSAGVIYPATSPDVVAVGGTALKTASNSRGWTETVWKTSSTEGTGSGCSSDEAKPSYQSVVSSSTEVNHLPLCES